MNIFSSWWELETIDNLNVKPTQLFSSKSIGTTLCQSSKENRTWPSCRRTRTSMVPCSPCEPETEIYRYILQGMLLLISTFSMERTLFFIPNYLNIFSFTVALCYQFVKEVVILLCTHNLCCSDYFPFNLILLYNLRIWAHCFKHKQLTHFINVQAGRSRVSHAWCMINLGVWYNFWWFDYFP